ncbi:MAG: aldo/keto reductase [Flexilinea flocculi]|jgi:aryl-alcohol dehydrogenase-like predicted oxidoreductase|nr:aldo/keto reductase [Flexilinea flocculi]
MKYSKFADDDFKVSKICLGTMNFADRCDYKTSEEIVRLAWELGINFIDTAAMYSNGEAERYLGKAMKALPREKIFLVTKVVKGIDRDSILSGIDESLERLQTDYVDLYLIHWPVAGMDLVEMMESLNQVVHSGKARNIGVCNFPAYLLAAGNRIAQERGLKKLNCNQVAYNLIERGVEVEILPQAILEKIAIMAYRPLAIGLLTGKFSQGMKMDPATRGATDARVITWLSDYGKSVDRFVHFAEKKGVKPAQLAAAWVCHSPAITAPIIGVSSTRQLLSSVEAINVELSDEDYNTVTEIFPTEVWEESLQLFPGLKFNFPRLRRNLFLHKA